MDKSTLNRLSNDLGNPAPVDMRGKASSNGNSAPHGTTQVPPTEKRIHNQEKLHPIKRLIEVLNPSREKRLHNVTRAATKEMDKQLKKLLLAAASGRKGSHVDALRAGVKIHAALQPLGMKRADWSEQAAQRLAHGPSALKHLPQDRLLAMKKALEQYVTGNDLFAQLRYAIEADLLSRELEDVCIGTDVPLEGQRPLSACTFQKLVDLQARAQDVMQSAPMRRPLKDDNTEIPGTLFTMDRLRVIETAVTQAMSEVAQHTATVQQLRQTASASPVSERPMAEVFALKTAVDRVNRANGHIHDPELSSLQKQLDARADNYSREIERLAQGPVDRLEVRLLTADKLLELQRLLAQAPSHLPAIQQAIQDDVPRRLPQARNLFDSALRKAVKSNSAQEILKHLRQSITKLQEAEALYAQSQVPFAANVLAGWIRLELRRIAQDSTAGLQVLHDHLNGDLGRQLRQERANDPATPGRVEKTYLDTLNSVLKELVPPVDLPALPATPAKPTRPAVADTTAVATASQTTNRPPRQKGRVAGMREQRADAPTGPGKPRALMESDRADATSSIKTAFQKGVKDLPEQALPALLLDITHLLRSSNDLDTLRQAKGVIEMVEQLDRVDRTTMNEFKVLMEFRLKKFAKT